MIHDATLPKIKVVALDFDGVITNLNIDWDEALRLASIAAGYNVTNLIPFYEASYGTSVFHKVSKLIEQLELNALKDAVPTPSTIEFLGKLAEINVDTYIVSMQSTHVVKEFLNKYNLASYIKDVITRDMCPSKKAQVALVLKKSHVSPEEVLLVDDAAGNITSCKLLGVNCFHFEKQQDPQKIKEMWDAVLKIVHG
ncbi:MAG: HAD family hydrolase [Candidatus Bathyarchaeota archaeon]|nr:HAD family hydrolase [Candidatus Bathyarchaeota archaeon]